MPKAFKKAAAKKGSKVRTVTKGPHKGKLIAIPRKGHPVVGSKRGHKG
jgi:hypothetical protein